MNLVISLVLHVVDKQLLDGLNALLPTEGRPSFRDEVPPQWLGLYDSIYLLPPPDEIKSNNEYLFVSWYESDFSSLTYEFEFEKLGATVIYLYDAGNADADSDCDDQGMLDGGNFYLKHNNELVRLSAQNHAQLLPNINIQWGEEDNDSKIAEYLLNR